tara:strand:+ start:1676 stop:2179 length:504 start_codon:yes stop_codon:yes gene_type:complete
MHSSTRNYITVHNFSLEDFDYLDRAIDCDDDSFFEYVVPHLKEWGNVHHIELDDFEYDRREEELTLTCLTKWYSPISWLRAASCTHFFENKMITMATVTRDETNVTAVAVLDRDVLVEQELLSLEPETVGALYENDQVDDLDDLIWKPITDFITECKKSYLVDSEDL